jgi:hypothetical protein
MVVETAVVEITVVVETEEDINIFFYNIKKGVNLLTPFLFPHPPPSPKERELKNDFFVL